MAVDNELVNDLKLMVMDRFTATELVDLLDISVDRIFEAFIEDCLEFDFTEAL